MNAMRFLTTGILLTTALLNPGLADPAFLVKDINPNTLATVSSDPGNHPEGITWGISGFIQMGDLTFFAANDLVNGMELWRTDGTEAGTELFDINPGAESSSPSAFYRLPDNRLLFAAGTGRWGKEPHVMLPDGLVVQIDDIAAGTGSSDPARFCLVGDKIFFEANDGITGIELWALPADNLEPVTRARHWNEYR